MPKKHISATWTPTDATELPRQLGERMTAARLRRNWTRQMLSERAGLTPALVARVERGEPGTGIAAYMAVLWAMNLTTEVHAVASEGADEEGVALAARRERKRARPVTASDNEF
jgi:transcriptional regulator with XRE-family HTH domain